MSQSTGQDLVAFQVHPADLPKKFQQQIGFGHPSRYQPRSTELNFGEQRGTGVFPREQSLRVLLYILLIYPENFSNILNSIGHQLNTTGNASWAQVHPGTGSS